MNLCPKAGLETAEGCLDVGGLGGRRAAGAGAGGAGGGAGGSLVEVLDGGYRGGAGGLVAIAPAPAPALEGHLAALSPAQVVIVSTVATAPAAHNVLAIDVDRDEDDRGHPVPEGAPGHRGRELARLWSALVRDRGGEVAPADHFDVDADDVGAVGGVGVGAGAVADIHGLRQGDGLAGEEPGRERRVDADGPEGQVVAKAPPSQPLQASLATPCNPKPPDSGAGALH